MGAAASDAAAISKPVGSHSTDQSTGGLSVNFLLDLQIMANGSGPQVHRIIAAARDAIDPYELEDLERGSILVEQLGAQRQRRWVVQVER